MFELLNTIDAFVWGPAMIALLLGSHLFFTFKTGFIQRKLPQAIKLSLSSDPEGKGDISHFGALATALAATIGTGSIVGVATAILAGGPGAVFWMWLMAIVGAASAFVESTLAQIWKVRGKEGEFRGGPAYYIEKALGKRWLGILFAVLLILCFAFGFNGLQASTPPRRWNTTFPTTPRTARPSPAASCWR